MRLPHLLVALILALGLCGVAYLAMRDRKEATDENRSIALLPYGDIRSVTFYLFPFDETKYYLSLRDSIPAIREAGFNTIWIVSPWVSYDPRPLESPRFYEESRFEHLRQVLALLEENEMKAILGLNYLGKGWSPEGIDPGRWITDSEMYEAFESYVGEFLRRIEEFNNSVYIVFFTEGTEPEGLDPYADAERHASILRETLGSLPSRLEPRLRRKFSIGFQDYSIVNLGWGNGACPTPLPTPYDFVSMVYYGFEDASDETIRSEFDERIDRFRGVFPGTPLIVGEMGASLCEHGEENQARVILAKVSHALDWGLGFNLWHWRPIPGEDDCQNAAFMGLAITREDNTTKAVVDELRAILRRA